MSRFDLTGPVDAAARDAYDRFARQRRETFGPAQLPIWEDLDPSTRLHWRQSVLPIVKAALDSLPDDRALAWEQGYVASADDAATNPYLAT